jgi:L-aminopeptidase/D-esterase-like protein
MGVGVGVQVIVIMFGFRVGVGVGVRTITIRVGVGVGVRVGTRDGVGVGVLVGVISIGVPSGSTHLAFVLTVCGFLLSVVTTNETAPKKTRVPIAMKVANSPFLDLFLVDIIS